MSQNSQKNRVLMIVENCGYLRDPRVRKQAKALKESGYQVTVISPGSDKLLWGQLINGVLVYQFPAIQFFHGPFRIFPGICIRNMRDCGHDTV